VIYNFNQETARWKINIAYTNDEVFVNSEKGWKLTT